MIRLRRIAFAAICTLLKLTTLNAQQVCYTVSDSKDSLYQFMLGTGQITKQSKLSGVTSVEAATLNLKGDTFWMLNADELYYVETSSSSFTPTKISGSNISSQTLTGSEGSLSISDFDAMSIDTAGNIWAGNTSTDPSLLVVIDPTTGNVKEDFFGSGIDYLKVDNSSYDYLRFDAMAFDPVTNELFANMNGSSSLYDFVFKINTSTGAMTLVRQFTTIDDIEGMGFDALGDLYVTTGSSCSNSANKNSYWKVDIVTGQVTKLYTLSGGDMETCDCIVGDPIKSNEISGYFYYDDNWDGSFGSGNDTGAYNHLMCLYRDVNGNQQFNAGIDTLLDTTRTYATGYYKFRFLYDSGTEHYLVISDTSGLGSENTYSTPNVTAVSFSSGGSRSSSNNIGYSFDGNKISGYALQDNDLSGTKTDGDDGIPGITVQLYRDNNSDGKYDGGDSFVDSVDTDANGLYTFVISYSGGTENYLTFITLSDLNPGDSMISDQVKTYSYSSDKNHDSLANYCIFSSPSQNIITGTIYGDQDEDSVYDAYEEELEGVKVLLYSDLNGNGTVDGADAIIDSALVGNNGFYAFPRTYSGSGTDCFVVKIRESTGPTGSLLTHTNSREICFSSGGNIDRNNNFGMWGGALPVEWLSFEAMRQDNQVLLNWSTAMEENNDYFEIQRSSNAEQWEILDVVNGVGSTSAVSSYVSFDSNPLDGITYYRLRQVDFDGNYSYSKLAVVNDLRAAQVELTLYPNPARTAVSFNVSRKVKEIQVWSLDGLLVERIQISGSEAEQVRLKVDGFLPGMYLVKALADSGITAKRLMIYE